MAEAQRALREGDGAEARGWLETAAEQAASGRPDHQALTLSNLGLALRKLGEWKGAISCYERSLRLAQASWLQGRVSNNLALLEHRLGRLPQARRRYTEALALCSAEPEDRLGVARVCVNLAWLHLQSDRATQAETLLKRARGLLPADASAEASRLEARFHLAATRLAAGQKKLAKAELEALQAFRAAQRLGSDEPWLQALVRAVLADVYSRQAAEQLGHELTRKDGERKRDRADELLVEVAARTPFEPGHPCYEAVDLLWLRAEHQVRMGRWEQADEELRRLLLTTVDMDGLDPAVTVRCWDRAAHVLRQLDQHELAAEAVRQGQLAAGLKPSAAG